MALSYRIKAQSGGSAEKQVSNHRAFSRATLAWGVNLPAHAVIIKVMEALWTVT